MATGVAVETSRCAQRGATPRFFSRMPIRKIAIYTQFICRFVTDSVLKIKKVVCVFAAQIWKQSAHLFSPLYHSNVGGGTAAASHLIKAVRPRATPLLLISWIDGATGGTESHRVSRRHNNNNECVVLCGRTVRG